MPVIALDKDSSDSARRGQPVVALDKATRAGTRQGNLVAN